MRESRKRKDTGPQSWLGKVTRGENIVADEGELLGGAGAKMRVSTLAYGTTTVVVVVKVVVKCATKHDLKDP